VVECAGLLNRWRGTTSPTGSNPVLSANDSRRPMPLGRTAREMPGTATLSWSSGFPFALSVPMRNWMKRFRWSIRCWTGVTLLPRKTTA
jgi:hypothetical protein